MRNCSSGRRASFLSSRSVEGGNTKSQISRSEGDAPTRNRRQRVPTNRWACEIVRAADGRAFSAREAWRAAIPNPKSPDRKAMRQREIVDNAYPQIVGHAKLFERQTGELSQLEKRGGRQYQIPNLQIGRRCANAKS